MADNTRVIVDVGLDTSAKTVAKLQKQLDHIGKQLTLNITKTNLLGQTTSKAGAQQTNSTNNTTKAINAQASSMQKLKDRYDASKISAEQFLKYSNKILESQRFGERSISAQAKALKIREQVEKQIAGSAKDTLSVNSNLLKAKEANVSAQIKESERIITQLRKQSDVEDKLADRAKKYPVTKGSIKSGQQGSLTNRLQGMEIGKDSVLEKFQGLV